ncbi:MAG TPA: hypothetical protein VIU12_32930 [Chryseolinea sp.]
MKSTINKLSLIIGIACLAACADDSLDPFRLKEQTKGSILALRGDSFAALNDNGCSNSFFKNKIVGDEAFVMDVEYLSEDPTSLQEIQVFAHYQRPDPDNAGQFLTDTRAKVATFPGSALTSTGGANPTGVLSIPLASILPVVGDPDDLEDGDLINIESDLLLTNGTVVFSTSVVNVGLYQSGIFYPAQTLVYCFDDINNYYPVPKFALRVGTPLKAASKDTLNITYGSEIGTPPTVALVGNVGTLGALVADPDDDSGTKFYAIYTAGPGYTGPISVTVKGAVNGGSGATAGLVQQTAKTATIQVDNIGPQLVGNPVVQNLANPAAGANIGRDQYVGITLNFQEELDPGTDLLISVTGQFLDPVDEDVMIISEDGRSATYTYIYKDTDDGSVVTPGALDFEVTGGADLAGNAFAGTTFTTLNDIGEPPVPVIALAADYDIGNNIVWSATTTTGPNNPGGATSGTIFYAAVPSGSPAPEQAVRTVKGVVVNAGFDFGTAVPVETGSFDVTNGAGGASSKFTSNGDFDVYFYFVNATGNVSENTGATVIQMQ